MSATHQRNADGQWFARCLICKWRGATYDGPLAQIDAFEDAEEHDGHKHV